MRDHIRSTVSQFQPLLLVMGVDCRVWNQFNANLNWSSPERQQQLQALREEEEPLVKFAAELATVQWRAGRYFLIENPQRSKLWTLPCVEKLLSLPGVWSTVLDAGAFGAEIDGDPIAKPMRWIGNQAGLDEALTRRLTPLEKAYCKPVEGSMTRRSQEYPDELCHVVLQELRGLIYQTNPSRFGPPPHRVWAVEYPTGDLGLWDDIASYLIDLYERSPKRPFDIPIDSDHGRTIAELLRLEIQATFAPTQRRLPFNLDYLEDPTSFFGHLKVVDAALATEVVACI